MKASELWPVWPEAVDRPLDERMRGFKDVLDGLAVLYESPLIRDVRNTLLAFPDSRLPIALNKKQTACKKWVVEMLARHALPRLGATLGQVHILAGWYGVLAAMLLNDERLKVARVTVVDIDPSCEAVALSLNASHVPSGRFAFRTGDILALDYGAPPAGLGRPDMVINTSCEHIADFDAWYARLPEGLALVLQSNDYRVIPEHANCVDSLADFARQTPMRELFYEGALELPNYTRFMRMGRK